VFTFTVGSVKQSSSKMPKSADSSAALQLYDSEFQAEEALTPNNSLLDDCNVHADR